MKEITYNHLKENGVFNLFSLKPFSYPNDDIKKYFNIPDEANQTHSNNIKVITEDNLEEEINDCDGLITNLKRVGLLIKVADCESIYFYDKKKKVIGNIHAGWRGTLNKIVVEALDIFKKQYHSNMNDILVFINPSLLLCCSEFSLEEEKLFQEEFKDFIYKKEKKDKCYIDLCKINEYLLLQKGILIENIYLSNFCTKCHHDKFHSYRYNKTDKRNISLLYIE